MANSYLTSDTLIDSIKRRVTVPTSQVTFEDIDFLALANEEIQIGLLPIILQMHEEYLVYPQNIPLVGGQNAYVIPYRAIGQKLRTIFFQDIQGNLFDMSRILLDDVPFYRRRGANNFYNMYYVQGNTVNMVPDVSPSVVGSLATTYYLRPNQLVTSDRIATITAVDFTSGNITVNQVPSILSVTATCDFLETTGGHRLRAMDKLPLSLNSGTNIIQFTPSDIPSDLVVGDIIALSGECYIPQIPDELHSILAERVAARCMEAQGDMGGLQASNTKIQEMEMKSGTLISNRMEGNVMKVVNLRGLLRDSKLRRRRNIW